MTWINWKLDEITTVLYMLFLGFWRNGQTDHATDMDWTNLDQVIRRVFNTMIRLLKWKEIHYFYGKDISKFDMIFNLRLIYLLSNGQFFLHNLDKAYCIWHNYILVIININRDQMPLVIFNRGTSIFSVKP